MTQEEETLAAAALLEKAENACDTCQQCELGQSRIHTVFGSGSPTADLLFVGEAPGEVEDQTGIPFVGPAGKLLDRYLFAVDIPREEVYITNILKCRPPHNRDPLPKEVSACMMHLTKQLEIIRPRMIVCLGRIAAMQLIKPDFRITKEHGVWFERNGYPICAVYHPSALLRDPSKREDMYGDMLCLREKLTTFTNSDR